VISPATAPIETQDETWNSNFPTNPCFDEGRHTSQLEDRGY
jgi:hypothetical protein